MPLFQELLLYLKKSKRHRASMLEETAMDRANPRLWLLLMMIRKKTARA